MVYNKGNMTKFNCFLQNAEMLNNKFNIVPLLYGSLGLEVLTKSSLNADDIDILVPEEETLTLRPVKELHARQMGARVLIRDTEKAVEAVREYGAV